MAGCMQSASAFGSGVYPDGTGPKNYLPTRPTIVPVHTEKEEDDAVLDARKAYCKKRVKQDSRLWAHAKGAELIHDYSEVIDMISSLCGTNLSALIREKSPKTEKMFKLDKTKFHKDISESEVALNEPTFGNLPDGVSSLVHFQSKHDYKGDLPTGIKDIADALIFDKLSGMPASLQNLTENDYQDIHYLAFRMVCQHVFIVF